jgi:tripartite-type tricarboxylate transporter receptor subunit TctC
VADLIALAKARPGKLSAASSSIGSTGSLAFELFKATTGVDIVQVPYKGTGPALTDLIGGHVDMMFAELGFMQADLKAGVVKGLAVTTPQRALSLPTVPTLSESLPGFEVTGWWGLFAPAGTPASIVSKINRDVVEIVNQPDLRKTLEAMQSEPSGTTPEALAARIQSDIQKFTRAVNASGFKVE